MALKDAKTLTGYAQYCLDNKFEKSGEVLQDCVNEMGRRLTYQVTNGRYAGVRNDIGFDGLWFDGSRHLVIEVKTTDAYRINLDTITNYGTKLKQSNALPPENISTLIVVGRQDTGDLEAQVRGSQHAWSVRLISVDALAKLVFVNDQFRSTPMLEKIRRILLPFEYTRVDNIVELVFETQQETEVKLIAEAEDESSENDASNAVSLNQVRREIDFTPRAELDQKRENIAKAFFASRHTLYDQVTRTHYVSKAGDCHIIVAVSKRYERDYQPYWYALHPHWLEKLSDANEGYFILGCMDNSVAYVLPIPFITSHLVNLNKTEKVDGKTYWHIALNSDNGIVKLNLSRVGTKVDLSPYEMKY